MWDYWSELEIMGPDDRYLEFEKLHLRSMPTEKLIKRYNELSAHLDEKRRNEPPMKRGRKNKYRGWVTHTHNCQELLDFIEGELIERKQKDPLGKIEYKEEWWMY